MNSDDYLGHIMNKSNTRYQKELLVICFVFCFFKSRSILAPYLQKCLHIHIHKSPFFKMFCMCSMPVYNYRRPLLEDFEYIVNNYSNIIFEQKKRKGQDVLSAGRRIRYLYIQFILGFIWVWLRNITPFNMFSFVSLSYKIILQSEIFWFIKNVLEKKNLLRQHVFLIIQYLGKLGNG